jgi:hypothetical protein
MLLGPQKLLDWTRNQTGLEHFDDDDKEEEAKANPKEQDGPMHRHLGDCGNLTRHSRGRCNVTHVVPFYARN